jgi:hypothetical protein
MTLVVDSINRVWEEQSAGVFIRLEYPRACRCVTGTPELDIILMLDGSLYYRSIYHSRILSRVQTNESFIGVAWDMALSTDGYVYRLHHDGRLISTNIMNVSWIGTGWLSNQRVVLLVSNTSEGFILWNDGRLENSLEGSSKLVTYQDQVYRVNYNNAIEGLNFNQLSVDMYGNEVAVNGMLTVINSELVADNIMQVESQRGIVLVSYEGLSYSHHYGVLIVSNIPPERFLSNLVDDRYQSPRLGVIIVPMKTKLIELLRQYEDTSINSSTNLNVRRVISDRLVLVTWNKGDIEVDAPILRSSIKPSYQSSEVTSIINQGVELHELLTRNSRMMDDNMYDELTKDIEFFTSPIEFISSITIVDAVNRVLSNSENVYHLLLIPDDSIPVIYKADGMGSEVLLSAYGDVLNYHYTPSRQYPEIVVSGFLYDNTIYSDIPFYSIHYNHEELKKDVYNPLSDEDHSGVVYVQNPEGSILRSFKGRVNVYVQDGKVYGHGGVRIASNVSDIDQLNGFYEVKLLNGRFSDWSEQTGRLVMSRDAEYLNDTIYFNYPDPFDVKHSVLNYIKIQHRSSVSYMFKRIRSKPYQNIGVPILLELGAGRGADIWKWNSLYKKVVAVEPNIDNYHQLLLRMNLLYEDCKKKNKFCVAIRAVNTQAQNWSEIESAIKQLIPSDQSPYGSVTTVAMIDVLTFFGDRELSQLAKTISNALNKNNGMFMFKVMDGYSVIKLLKDHGTKNEKGQLTWSYGNFSITRIDRDRIQFSNEGIVGEGQIEYLFFVDKLRNAFRNVGLKLNTNQYNHIKIPPSKIPELNMINALYRTGVWFTDSTQKSIKKNERRKPK